MDGGGHSIDLIAGTREWAKSGFGSALLATATFVAVLVLPGTFSAAPGAVVLTTRRR